MPCEDAPCCGCCGTNLYGVKQDGGESPPYCDVCGWNHFGDCPMEVEDESEEQDADEVDVTDPGVKYCSRCRKWHAGPRCGTFSEEALDDEVEV